MSYELMILRSIDDPDQPLGLADELLARARRDLGVDLHAGRVRFGGAAFDVELALEGATLTYVNLTPHGDGWEDAARAIARVLGGAVFDPQVGFELGAAPPDVSAKVDGDYVLELGPMNPLGAMGSEAEVWSRLAPVFDVAPDRPEVRGDGWSMRCALVPMRRGAGVSRVAFFAAWRDPAAQRALFAAFVAGALALGWVPFDPQRNDTVE